MKALISRASGLACNTGFTRNNVVLHSSVTGEAYKPQKVSEIEINDLNDLLSLVKKEGHVIVKESIYEEYDLDLTIYDGYLE